MLLFELSSLEALGLILVKPGLQIFDLELVSMLFGFEVSLDCAEPLLQTVSTLQIRDQDLNVLLHFGDLLFVLIDLLLILPVSSASGVKLVLELVVRVFKLPKLHF